MTEQYVGEICQYPYNFELQDWAFCQGQSLPIGQYQALFALIGTTYGGDGRNTFNLPDLRPRDEAGNPLQLRVGQIHEGRVYMEWSIALQGIFPQRKD